jgi:hypothetical protein
VDAVTWIKRFFSIDDLWSVIGYAGVIAFSQVNRPPLALAAASLLASGMIAITWLASGSLRARNAQRYPNIRIVAWALVAVVSGVIVAR